MRIMLLTARVESGGNSQKFGDIIELPDDEAKRLIAAGSARRVSDNGIETAMVEVPGREGSGRRSLRRV